MTITTVFGAPGAGKTTVLRSKFEAALADGLGTNDILVIAASREAANDLRDELALKLQAATSGDLARTLNSCAFEILRERAAAQGSRMPELISGSEQDRILAEIIESHLEDDLEQAGWPKHINKQVVGLNGFRSELRDLISISLEHGVDPDELRGIGLQFGRAEWVAAADWFDEYLVSVGAFENRFDSAMLLREAISILKTYRWPQRWLDLKLILVDDAQELTPAASDFIAVLASKGASLVLLGDPDSSTLGFRAADPRAMANLADRVAGIQGKKVEIEVLDASLMQRAEAISAALGRVSAQIDTARAGRQRKALAASKPDAETVIGRVFNQPQEELAWLGRSLREAHLYDGIAWNEMAVVARSRNALEQLSAALAYESVPLQIVGSQSPLRDEFGSRVLLRLAQACFSSEAIQIEQAIEFLSSPLCGLDSLGLRRLRRALRREELQNEGWRNSDELIVELFRAEGSVATVASQEGKRVDAFLKLYFEARKIAGDDSASIEDLLWHIWNTSNLEKSWRETARGVGEVAVQANRNLDAIVALFAAANRYVERNPGADPRLFVNQQLALGLPEDTLALNNESADLVSLVTPSGLIGRRFKLVALPQLIEGVWPNLRPRSSLLGATALDALKSGRVDDPNELKRSELPDELRMLYKSVGAASQKILVSVANSEDTQTSQFVNLLLGGVPEPISHSTAALSLRGMAGSLRRRLATSTVESETDSLALGLARLASAGVAGAHPDSWYGMLPLSTIEPLTDLQDPEAQVYVRPSQLESFLKCPLHWFLGAHGGSDYTFSANLGTLLHKSFELATEINEDALWQLVDSKWHTLKFESDWLEQAGRRRAKNMIANMVQYIREFEAAGGQVIGKEVNFEFDLGRARVRGQVDRLELYPDGRVMIVDLKTGAKDFTKDEAQNHAQLGLYQLGFENGAFSHLDGLSEAETLGGAKLLLVGTKLAERTQDSIATDEFAKEKFEQMVASATAGMAMADHVFVAQVGSHCTNENEFGSCKLHLTKAVSFGG
ncbi:MAG: hypothetical protein RLZZ258_530 [Actinomycetota bacterium]